MKNFEKQYLDIANQILSTGFQANTRNAVTKSIFCPQIIIDLPPNEIPIITTRKMFYGGVFGEVAAFLRGPKSVSDFEKFGCNYWDYWADQSGDLVLSYGNDWINWNSATKAGTGINQIQNVIDSLRNDPHGRRHIVTGWNPEAIEDGLSLPCCHTFYQWYVTTDNTLEFMYYQRSADWMVGVPSNMIMAYLMNILMADQVGMKPGRVIMNFGNAHIYEKHWGDALNQVNREPKNMFAKYELVMNRPIFDFTPDCINISDYEYHPAVKYFLYP